MAQANYRIVISASVLARALRGVLLGAILGFSQLSATPAAAQSPFPCTCRYAGADYDQGACVCIRGTGGQSRLACCGKVLNNSSWSFPDRGCPIAESIPPATLQPDLAESLAADGAAGTATPDREEPRS